uniref:DNA ligase n=1 Tax=Lygus hesperus TaxID=30085 RepID=A0A0A9YT71_LYGHE
MKETYCPTLRYGYSWDMVSTVNDPETMPEDPKWLFKGSDVVVFCSASEEKYCSKVLNIDWERSEGVTNEVYLWKVEVGHSWLVCKSVSGTDCPTISNKIWKKIKTVDHTDEVPKGSKWAMEDGKVIVWCGAAEKQYCSKWLDMSWEETGGVTSQQPRRPKITGGWFTKKNRLRGPDGYVVVAITCIARRKSRCPHVTGGGPWHRIKHVDK